MTAELFQPHLQPGERIVWSASASPALIAAATRRRRIVAGFMLAGALLLAAFFTVRFVETVAGYATADIGASLLAPLYGAFALAMLALAWASIRRLNPPPPRATSFAATDRRLIALTSEGAIADELPAAEIDAVIAGGRAQTPDIFVLRKDDPHETRAFAIEHIEKPLAAKAIIEETFLSLEPDTSGGPTP